MKHWDEEKQIALLCKGTNYVNLARPATIGDGIMQLSESEKKFYEGIFADNRSNYRLQKFVPASGAATRMFKFLFEYLKDGKSSCELDIFLKNLHRFPFYAPSLQNLPDKDLVHHLLYDPPYQFAHKPKAFIPFHKYQNGEVKNALEEHLSEAKFLYLNNIHFTLSPQHEQLIEPYLKLSGFHISYSFQNPDSDTVCIDLEGNLVTQNDGSPLKRPAGHGALLENINRLNADIIFVKNIDNIQPHDVQIISAYWKKIMAGMLMEIIALRNRILSSAKNERFDEKSWEILSAKIKRLSPHIHLPEERKQIFNLLRRPVRIAGMVKNTGAPGGGPFWVKNASGRESLQIVEKSQINLALKDQQDIFEQSTHFNPVDMLLHIKDYDGTVFNLSRFRDEDTYFVSEKSHQGKPVKALELPGLWNGSMANWLTFFIEIPLEIFTPVKTVNDLLKPQHQPLS